MFVSSSEVICCNVEFGDMFVTSSLVICLKRRVW